MAPPPTADYSPDAAPLGPALRPVRGTGWMAYHTSCTVTTLAAAPRLTL